MADIKSNTSAILPELTIIERGVYCTSLQIADHFEKEHFHVLRDIENIVAQVTENLYKTKLGGIDEMFPKGDYEITTGLNTKVKKPMYLLSRDGFMLLAMGYEGAKAMEHKLSYMNAFNQMEERLISQGEPVDAQPERITAQQYWELNRRVTMIAERFHMKQSAESRLFNLVRIQLNIGNLRDLPAVDYDKAIAILENADVQSIELQNMRIEIEKVIVEDYVCKGVPFTGTLRKKFTEMFQLKLPPAPNWRDVILRLEGPESSATT